MADGTKRRDLTGDGPSADDPPLAGVGINLWRDGGDGSFGAGGGDDTLAGSAVTDGSGSFGFLGLVPGSRYFIAEDPASLAASFLVQTYGGDDFPGGIGFYTVDATADLVAAGRNFGNAVAADLSILKTAMPDAVEVGDPVVFVITVNNAGPGDAAAVTVTDMLPAQLSLVSTSGCVEDPAGVPTCTLGTIPAAGSAQYTITTTADSAGSVVNQAAVSSPVPELVSGNETATAGVTISAPPTSAVVEVPTLGAGGMLLLALALAAAGLMLVATRRQRT